MRQLYRMMHNVSAQHGVDLRSLTDLKNHVSRSMAVGRLQMYAGCSFIWAIYENSLTRFDNRENAVNMRVVKYWVVILKIPVASNVRLFTKLLQIILLQPMHELLHNMTRPSTRLSL